MDYMRLLSNLATVYDCESHGRDFTEDCVIHVSFKVWEEIKVNAGEVSPVQLRDGTFLYRGYRFSVSRYERMWSIQRVSPGWERPAPADMKAMTTNLLAGLGMVKSKFGEVSSDIVRFGIEKALQTAYDLGASNTR